MTAEARRELDDVLAISATQAEASEAAEGLGECQEILALLTKPDMSVTAAHIWFRCIEAEGRARELVTKLKGAS